MQDFNSIIMKIFEMYPTEDGWTYYTDDFDRGRKTVTMKFLYQQDVGVVLASNNPKFDIYTKDTIDCNIHTFKIHHTYSLYSFIYFYKVKVQIIRLKTELNWIEFK